jgi:uncharacterized protein (DUF2062 family)
MQRLFQSGASVSDHIRTTQEKILDWLKCGVTPRQLAFTLALGFAIGCIPLLGVTTGICALLALVLKLNMPAIQAANWMAMPLQIVLLIPFLRLGQWLFRGQAVSFQPVQLLSQIEAAPWHAVAQMSGVFAHATLAWMILAVPTLILITTLLTPVLHRVSKLAAIAAD